MTAAEIEKMADEVAKLMGNRLNVKGRGLRKKLRYGGKALPRRIRHEAEYILQALDQAQVPKLMVQTDPERLRKAHKACLAHLRPLGAGARRKGLFMQMLTSLGLAAVATAALVIGILVWRGYL